MQPVHSNRRFEVIAEEELQPGHQPEEQTDAEEDGGVLETQAEVHTVMAGTGRREVAAIVLSSLERRERGRVRAAITNTGSHSPCCTIAPLLPSHRIHVHVLM